MGYQEGPQELGLPNEDSPDLSASERNPSTQLIPPEVLPPHGAHDHHAFHEDAKPGDLRLQFGTRSFNASKQLVTRIKCCTWEHHEDQPR